MIDRQIALFQARAYQQTRAVGVDSDAGATEAGTVRRQGNISASSVEFVAGMEFYRALEIRVSLLCLTSECSAEEYGVLPIADPGDVNLGFLT